MLSFVTDICVDPEILAPNAKDSKSLHPPDIFVSADQVWYEPSAQPRSVCAVSCLYADSGQVEWARDPRSLISQIVPARARHPSLPPLRTYTYVGCHGAQASIAIPLLLLTFQYCAICLSGIIACAVAPDNYISIILLCKSIVCLNA